MKSYNEKIMDAVTTAIASVKVENIDEQIMQTEYIINISKILENYEELRPIFNKYFNKDKRFEEER